MHVFMCAFNVFIKELLFFKCSAKCQDLRDIKVSKLRNS